MNPARTIKVRDNLIKLTVSVASGRGVWGYSAIQLDPKHYILLIHEILQLQAYSYGRELPVRYPSSCRTWTLQHKEIIMIVAEILHARMRICLLWKCGACEREVMIQCNAGCLEDFPTNTSNWSWFYPATRQNPTVTGCETFCCPLKNWSSVGKNGIPMINS